MARAVYIVVQSLGKWWVDFEGRPYGPFSSREMARLEGISLARFLTHSGRSSEVWAVDDTGVCRREWQSEPESKPRQMQAPVPVASEVVSAPAP